MVIVSLILGVGYLWGLRRQMMGDAA